jgi:hypothetical protein
MNRDNKSCMEESKNKKSILYASIASGTIQAILFNPIDRALYLRVHHRTSIFNKEIWKNPFQGFTNVVLYRTISGASYFYLQDKTKQSIEKYKINICHPYIYNFIVGFTAGSINGMILNQFQIIKYQMWSKNHGNFISVAKQMYSNAGIQMFFRGIKITIMRDCVFGFIYEILRLSHVTKHYDQNVQFLYNMNAAIFASIASSPFNYCRSCIYGTSYLSSSIGINNLLRFLYLEIKSKKSIKKKITHLNFRLNIGLGTMRVGFGMGCGQFIFNKMLL